MCIRDRQEYYPEYRVESPLPPDLLELCIGFLIEEKKEYWLNGQPWSQETYVNGKKHGEWKQWWGNGQLWSQGTYVSGILCFTYIGLTLNFVRNL